MLSFTTAFSHFFLSPHSVVDFNPLAFPSVLCVVDSGRRRIRKEEKRVLFNDGAGGLGFSGFKKGYCRCTKSWGSEGDLGLESEILEFMRSSENSNAFPSKKRLIEAGRMDLVEGILKQGGWLSLGWDLDDEEVEEEEEKQERVQENGYLNDWESIMAKKCSNGVVQYGDKSAKENSILEENELPLLGFSSFADNSSNSVSSSGRSLGIVTEDDSGIEGILSRLEKERNINLGFDLREKGKNACLQSNDSKDDWLSRSSKDATVAGIKKSGRPAVLSPNKGLINDWAKPSQSTSLSDFNGLGNSPKPDMWRTWSNQRAGFSAKDFEAAEITLDETGMGSAMDASKDENFAITEGISEPLDRREETNPSREEINHNQIRIRLQNMELELSSALRSLRSKTDEVTSQGDPKSDDNLLKLSDAWELQENEIMNAQNKLRSIRAKLAVLEGKMALAIIDAQKMLDEKQYRIDDTRKALRLLRTACIVWPNSASEVLLAGSFDGWATQRKMEKSSTGIFSLCLQLYPGRYEIKFIVDGQWKTDPLRPIVGNNGYENNLLVIT